MSEINDCYDVEDTIGGDTYEDNNLETCDVEDTVSDEYSDANYIGTDDILIPEDVGNDSKSTDYNESENYNVEDTRSDEYSETENIGTDDIVIQEDSEEKDKDEIFDYMIKDMSRDDLKKLSSILKEERRSGNIKLGEYFGVNPEDTSDENHGYQKVLK